MKYKIRNRSKSQIYLGLCLLIFILVFFLGQHKIIPTGGWFGAVLIFTFIGLLANLFVLGDSVIIQDGQIMAKKLGLTLWQVVISDIAIIDDSQNKFDAEYNFKHILAHSRMGINYIGFNIKTIDGKNFTFPHAVENFQGLVSELQIINPQIQSGKVTEEKNEKFRQATNINISGPKVGLIIFGFVFFCIVLGLLAAIAENKR